MGRIIAVGSFASVLTLGLVWLGFELFHLDYAVVYVVGGGLTVVIALIAYIGFPQFPEKTQQRKNIVIRKRYWLFYALTFMSGARRQIFVVFAGFLMVEKFGYDVAAITLLFLINALINVYLAPKIGRLIGRIGERKALLIEYTGLISCVHVIRFRQHR